MNLFQELQLISRYTDLQTNIELKIHSNSISISRLARDTGINKTTLNRKILSKELKPNELRKIILSINKISQNHINEKA